MKEAICEEEKYFVSFLHKFMASEQNRYYVLEKDGDWVSDVVIRGNVNKSNVASLTTHKKCEFRIELENGINFLTGEERDYVYGMIYEV